MNIGDWRIYALLLTASLCVPCRSALGQGYSPAEAPRHMTVPEGLAVELVAAEPLVRQPVAIEFDDRGRLWCIQYLQYPNPSGLNRAKVDRYSRTTYDRRPEPPPRGPKGADRITILIDEDGDGRADSSKDFLSDLNLASGLAFGHGGVFVLQVPYLLFYADRDGDDRPDGDPDVLLTGFGMEDAHSVANSLSWGPDGWLYGCQGSTVTSNIRGIEFQQGVWRYHPITRRFELFCEGGGNSWGLDFDRHGNLFYSTNYGGYAMLHGVQGGYYWKQFGKHGALHNPYAFGYFDHVPHENLRGGHVTVGGIVYQADLLGPAYRDRYIAADLLGHAMYWHDLLSRGSTFAARLDGQLLAAGDTWFAPSDVTVGPDGSVYVCDWHDQRTAHPDPDADWDRTNGRIYRIRPQGAAKPAAERLAARSGAELVARLGDANEWYVRKARRLLADRRDPEMIFPLRTLVLESPDEHRALEALWALYVSGGLSDEFAARLLGHPSADVRWWTVRLVGDENHVAPAVAGRMAEMAGNDASVDVRAQLACTAKRLPPRAALQIMERLVAHDDDRGDPYIPLLLWWAVERHAVDARDDVLALFTRPEVWQRPLVHDVILERLVRRYAAEASPAGYRACARLLQAAETNGGAADRALLLAALDRGLSERSADRGGSAGTLFAAQAGVTTSPSTAAPPVTSPLAAKLPVELIAQLDRAWREGASDPAIVRLAARMGRTAAQRTAIAWASDSSIPAARRLEAIRILADVGGPASVEPLLKIVASQGSPELGAAALEALARFDDPRIATKLLAALSTLSPKLQPKAADVLLSRHKGASQLLEAVDQGTIDAKTISVDQLRSVSLHGDAALDALVKKHWGSVQGGTPEERLAEMRRINNDLRAGRGELAAGKSLFSKHCATCHRLFGEGNQIGPDLTHANRKNLDELLSTIVNPSAVIRKEFMSFLAHTTDGRVLTGLLVEQTPSTLTLLTAKNERIAVNRDQIETLVESLTSLMPDNLLGPLKPQELRDLFAYLQSEPAIEAR